MSDDINVPEGTRKVLGGMTPEQFAGFVSDLREDGRFVTEAPALDAIASAREAIRGLELGDAQGAVESLLDKATDDVAVTIRGIHAGVVGSDLEASVKESVLGALGAVAEKHNVELPAATEEPEGETDEPEEAAREQTEDETAVRLLRLEAREAAREALDPKGDNPVDGIKALQPETRKLVQDAIFADIEAGEIAGADAAREAVSAKAAEYQRVTESLPERPSFGDIPSRDQEQRATEEDRPSRSPIGKRVTGDLADEDGS